MAEAYRTCGSYLLFKQILSDPLGHLYRAGEFDRGGIQRTVWLRVFDTPHFSAEDFASAFGRAAEIAGFVHSANVVSGVDCFVSGTAAAISCDYVPSQPLRLVFDRVVSERFPIPVDNALLILEKISLALSAALAAEFGGERVVHGFVHPCLIFVTNDGEGTVSGFGLGEELLNLIDEETIAGDVHPYLAPEVLQSRLPSQRGDVYSLGAILFQLLTGSPLPARVDERKAAIDSAQLAYEEIAVPEDIRALLLRCLAERPEERFSSAADFKKELDRLLYGGAYSPTTFNLALFMDRLFRSEIEAEELERAKEQATDVAPYLEPVVMPEPEAVFDSDSEPLRGGVNKLWYVIGGAGAVVAVVAAVWGIVGRTASPPAVPTPTAAEVAAQRYAQEEKMRLLAQSLVAEMMAEKEEQIREELTDRQKKIEDLQRRLRESEQRAEQGRLSAEEERRRADLQNEIAAEEKAQRQREIELETERQRVEEEGLRQAATQQTATAIAEEQALLSAVPTPTPPSPMPPAETPVPTPVPTPVATTEPTAIAETSGVIEENSFFGPSEVDSLPILVKKEKAMWSRAAAQSRVQGVVIIQVTVNADGLVDEAKVLRADHDGFGIPQSAVDAALQCRFKPALKDGVRVKSYATITEHYRFLLTRE